MEINEQVALKVLQTIDQGLVRGLGDPVPGQMCVEAAVCFALDLPHSDKPGCVSDTLRLLKIMLNDCEWSSSQSRAAGLRRLGIAQLGTKDQLDEIEFVKRVIVMVVNTTLAEALDRAGLSNHAKTCRNVTDIESARDAATDAFGFGAWSTSLASWSAAVGDVVFAANCIASSDPLLIYTYAVEYITRVVAWISSDLDDANCDKVLSDFAERVVQILIDMKAAGTQWLYLTET
jgi:hypothetical protein